MRATVMGVTTSLVAGLMTAGALLVPTAANAAPGDAFTPDAPTVFIAQQAPTQLQRAEVQDDGSFVFSDEGGPASLSYNAVGYNPANGYLYGMVTSVGGAIPLASLVRIGQDGVVTRVGTRVYTHPADSGGAANQRDRFFAGAFNPADGFFYVSDSGPNTTVQVINAATGALVDTRYLTLNGVASQPGIQDFSFKDGFAWGATPTGDVRRIDMTTGVITVFPGAVPAAPGGYGAVWTFGNGNLGLSANTTGNVTQLRIDGPATAAPTFTVVSTVPGPSSTANDGTAVPGLPTDLAVEKTAPAVFNVGDRITYELTVTNNGPGTSSGWTVSDTLPAGLTNVEVLGDVTSSIVGGVVTVNGGRLASGASVTFQIAADTTVAPGACIENVANVLGNEADSNPVNDEDSAQSCATLLTVQKSSDATASSRPGDTITYTVTATNNGEVPFTAENPAVVFDDLTGVLDDAEYNNDADASVTDGELAYAEPLLSWVGPLGVDESVQITYTATLQSGGDGSVRNVAWQPNDPEDPTAPTCDPAGGGTDPVTGENCAVVEYDLPRLTIDKVADRTGLPAVGEQATYTVTITNEGPGAYTADAMATMTDDLTAVLDDATIDESSFTASVGAVSYDEPTLSWSGALAAGETATITYSVTYTGEGDQQLTNLACVPESDVLPGAEACDVVRIPGAALSQWKSVASSATPAVAGSELTYTLYFENDGPAAATVDAVDFLTHVLDDADVTVEPSSDTLTATRTGERIDITGTLAPGETATVTYTVTVKPDGERGDDVAANFLLPDNPADPPVPPTDPVCEPVEGELPECTTTPIGAIEYVKTVTASTDPVDAGTVLTYTIQINNTGTAPMPVAREDVLTDVLDDATVDAQPTSDTADVTVTDIVDDRFAITGELAGGESATMTYSVIVNEPDDRGNNSANNFLVAPGDTPPAECVAGSPECTVTPLPMIEASKTSDPASGETVVAGQVVTYTLTFTNSGDGAGPVEYTDRFTGGIDDATLTTAPTTSDPALTVLEGDGAFDITGVLQPGQTVTVSYTVTVKPDGERGDNVLGNLLADSDIPDPQCGDEGVICTENPIPLLDSWKSVTAAPSPVAAGTVLTYTLYFENTGEATATLDHVDDLTQVTDDADVTTEPTSADGLSAVWTGNQIAITGEVPVDETFTVTYQVTVRADGARGDDLAANHLLNAGETPPATCEPTDAERPDCTVTPIGQLAASKSVEASTDPVDAGTVLTYTLTFENQGQGPVTVDHTDVLTGVLDDATLTADPATSDAALNVSEVTDGEFTVTGELDAAQIVTITYQVTVSELSDRGDNSADNFLVPTGEEPPAECVSGDATCTVTPLPVIEATKSSDPASGETVVAGQVVTYTLSFTNTGDGAGSLDYTDHLTDVLDDAQITTAPTASDPALSVVAVGETFEITGVLQPGQTVTVSYAVTVAADGERENNRLGNVLADSDVTDPQCGDDGVSCTENPTPLLDSWKTVTADVSPVAAGTVLTYTLHFENTGEAAASLNQVDDLTQVADDADVTTEPTSADGLSAVRTGDQIAITGDVPAGETFTVTYQVTVREDGARGDDIATNYLLDAGEEPPAACQPSDVERPDCTVTPIGQLLVLKSVASSIGDVEAGSVLTYTLRFDNQGEGAVAVDYTDVLTDVLDDATLTGVPEASDAALTASAVTDGEFTVTGELAAGQVVFVTYQVTVNEESDRGNNSANNFLVPTGEEPPAECAPGDATCTVTPLPVIVATKSSDPASASTVVAGQEVTYTLSFTNSGEAPGDVNYDDHLADVLDDAALTAGPTASAPALAAVTFEDRLHITGTLQPDQTVTVTYTVTVSPDAERENNRLGNVLADSDIADPQCGDEGVSCTEHLVPLIVETKSVDPASGTPVVAGQELTYMLTFRNDGEGAGAVDEVDDLAHVLDDADMVVEPTASDAALTVTRTDARMSITGSLEPGQTVTVTYAIEVRASGDRGDDTIANFLLAPDEVTPTEPVCTPGDGETPDCTVNPVGEIVPAKSVDPASGTTVESGAELTYTLTFENVGDAAAAVDYTDHMSEVLDDAALVGDAQAGNGLTVTGPEDGQLRITGTLQAGETGAVTYTVRVSAYDAQGDHQIANFLAPAGQEPPTVCVDTDPLCTVNPIDPPAPGGGLAITGGAIAWTAVGAATLALLIGAGLLIAARRRRSVETEEIG